MIVIINRHLLGGERNQHLNKGIQHENKTLRLCSIGGCVVVN